MTREPGTGNGQLRRHAIFGMRRPISTQCFVLCKEPQHYVSLFHHFPSPAKRHGELAYHSIGHVRAPPSSSRFAEHQWLVGQCLHQGLFPIPSRRRTTICFRVHIRKGLATMLVWGTETSRVLGVVFFSKNKKKEDTTGQSSSCRL